MDGNNLTEEEYQRLKQQEPSRMCQDCFIMRATIRYIDKEAKTVKFICVACQDQDPRIKDEPVIPKKVGWLEWLGLK